jgi:hypothetical protein
MTRPWSIRRKPQVRIHVAAPEFASDYFLLLDDLFKVVRNAFIKHKFSFKVSHKDKRRAWYKCNNKDCPWSVVAHLNRENKNEVIVDIVNSAYTCVGDAIAKGGAANCQE